MIIDILDAILALFPFWVPVLIAPLLPAPDQDAEEIEGKEKTAA